MGTRSWTCSNSWDSKVCSLVPCKHHFRSISLALYEEAVQNQVMAQITASVTFAFRFWHGLFSEFKRW